MENVKQSLEWKRHERQLALEKERKKIIILVWVCVGLTLTGIALFLVATGDLPWR